MVTLNINISEDGKTNSTNALELSHTHSNVLPNPTSGLSMEGTDSQLPSPDGISSLENSSFSGVPHPEGFEMALSSVESPVPQPVLDTVQFVIDELEIPRPSELEAGSTAKPKAKSKTRRTTKK